MEIKAKHKDKAAEEAKITKLVRELINGRPVNNIPDYLLTRVHFELVSAKERAIKDGLINRVQMIQKVMLDVEQYEKERVKLKSKINKSKNPLAKRDDSFLDDSSYYEIPSVAVLDSILDDLADGIPYEIAETQYIPFLIDRSKERIDEYLKIGEYFTAQKYENVHVRLVSLLEERQKERKIEGKITYLTNLLNETQEKLKEIQEEKKNKLEEHKNKVEDSIKKHQDEYDQTNAEFDAITNGPLPASARKLSSAYLNTREKERFLIQTRRYEEAAAIKAEADQMEVRELEILQNEFIEKREKKKKVMIERQEKSIKCIIENGERTKQKIINEYKQKIQEIQKTVENIQSRIKLVDSNSLVELPVIKDQTSSTSSIIKANSNTEITKNNRPIYPRETATSKLRSSPFVTQASPQIKTPQKTYKLKSDSGNKSKVESSLTFSSDSFISENDETENDEKTKNNVSDINIDGDFIIDDDENEENLQPASFSYKLKSSTNANKEIGKDLLQKKKKSSVKQPNSQLMKNRNPPNYDHGNYLHAFSPARKFASPSKRAQSQVRDRPPSSRLYSPNFAARKKNDKTDNAIRVGRTYSAKK